MITDEHWKLLRPFAWIFLLGYCYWFFDTVIHLFKIENVATVSFCFFIAVLCAIAIGVWSNRDEIKKAREAKELSDREYEEQQKLHEGDLTSLRKDETK